MKRRDFVAMTGATAAGLWPGQPLWRSGDRRDAGAAAQPRGPQEPTLSAAVFARRIGRLQAELTTRKLDLFVAEPSTNFEYFTGYNPGRSERLILLMVPTVGTPLVVCPAFEVERLKRNTGIADVRGWEERDNPWDLVKTAGRALKPAHRLGQVAVEPTTSYQSSLRMTNAMGGWRLQNGADVAQRLRIIKAPEEIELIRRAIAITEAAIAATFAQLAPGATERQVADVLAREFTTRGGGEGGGLVQFGPSSALPHGGPGGGTLAKETVVLIDCGCQVGGYRSDITRTIWYGDAPVEEFTKVFNLVHDAQTAAMELGRPLRTQCQEMDRAARAVITQGGYGQFFTHRLGHGLGMDGHEVPYLVEGNETPLEPGMVFTIEPGVYQLGKFGVRIEDDATMTDSGVQVLSTRPAKL